MLQIGKFHNGVDLAAAISVYSLNTTTDEEYNIFEGVTKCVDLCAAPGSWSQVLSKKLRDNAGSKIVSVDLQPMAPIPGVIEIQGDITKKSTAEEIIGHFSGEHVDLVVCDGAPDVTGLHDLDEYIQSRLLLAAFNITSHILKPGGTFIAKIFRGRDIDLLFAQMEVFFEQVTCCKPRSSRNSSIESFIVCQNYRPPEGYIPIMINPFEGESFEEAAQLSETNRRIVPFLCCGDLNAYDSDRTYPATDSKMAPLQRPIDAPYRRYLEMKRSNAISEWTPNDRSRLAN